MTWTSTSMFRTPPTRLNSYVSRKCSSLACIGFGMSPISSRKIVPRCAISNRPRLASRASVYAPASCPNSSLSTSCSGSEVQLTLTNGCVRRGPRAWMARATTSLPRAALATEQHVHRAPLLAEPRDELGDLRIAGDRPTSDTSANCQRYPS